MFHLKRKNVRMIQIRPVRPDLRGTGNRGDVRVLTIKKVQMGSCERPFTGEIVVASIRTCFETNHLKQAGACHGKEGFLRLPGPCCQGSSGRPNGPGRKEKRGKSQGPSRGSDGDQDKSGQSSTSPPRSQLGVPQTWRWHMCPNTTTYRSKDCVIVWKVLLQVREERAARYLRRHVSGEDVVTAVGSLSDIIDDASMCSCAEAGALNTVVMTKIAADTTASGFQLNNHAALMTLTSPEFLSLEEVPAFSCLFKSARRARNHSFLYSDLATSSYVMRGISISPTSRPMGK